MTATEAQQVLEPLVGTELGVGEWTSVTTEHLSRFSTAIGNEVQEIPALLMLALIPGMVSGIELPIEAPRLAVNYGLDQCRMISPLSVGTRIRARATLSGVELGKDWLQVKRRIEIESEEGGLVLEADTITRLVW